MEQHEESNPTHYPLGRGYGHDYMRGGEVFGGYGYREREDYAKTRGGTIFEDGELDVDDAGGAPEPRPTHPAHEGGHPPESQRASSARPDGDRDAPVPALEHTFGGSGLAWNHSRSYYVTQAQLQQRIYGQGTRGQED